MPLNEINKSPKTERIEHERLTSLINSMADAVIAVNEKVQIVLYNSAALNILDVNNIVFDGPLDKIFSPVDKELNHVDVKNLVRSAKTPISNRDLKLVYKDGSSLRLYISIAPVHLGYGEKGQSGYVILLRDITREKSLEEERDEFISVVSHELRTPIAITEGSLSNAQYIAEKLGSSNDIKTILAEAHKQIIFLSEMMNDLSTLSRAERGLLKVEIENINVFELVNELVKDYLPEAESKKLKLNTDLDPTLELLLSSKLYVREILQNFVTNALKYTISGSVTIAAKPQNGGIDFLISDTGLGISKADQKRVFEQFFRSEDLRVRKASGSGLGLYVTIKLARLINAELGLTSELNKGSTFTVFVPNLNDPKKI